MRHIISTLRTISPFEKLPSASISLLSTVQVYPDAEVLVQDEDTQPITQPIIAPVKTKTFAHVESKAPETMVSNFRTCLAVLSTTDIG
jgi:hypothetical protein